MTIHFPSSVPGVPVEVVFQLADYRPKSPNRRDKQLREDSNQVLDHLDITEGPTAPNSPAAHSHELVDLSYPERVYFLNYKDKTNAVPPVVVVIAVLVFKWLGFLEVLKTLAPNPEANEAISALRKRHIRVEWDVSVAIMHLVFY